MNEQKTHRYLVLTMGCFVALLIVGCAAEEQPVARQPAAPEAAPEAAGQGAAEAEVVVVAQADLMDQINADRAPMILDVRTVEEFGEGHVPGAMNIPHDELASRLAEVQAAREAGVIVYCRSGRRAGIAEQLLLEAGFRNVMHLEGDMLAWLAAELPTEKPKQ